MHEALDRTATTRASPRPFVGRAQELADFAAAFGEAGAGRIPGLVETDMEPYRGPDGSITTLVNSVFSTVPGSAARIAKAGVNRAALPQYGMSWEYEGRNAIQSEWKMEYAA